MDQSLLPEAAGPQGLQELPALCAGNVGCVSNTLDDFGWASTGCGVSAHVADGGNVEAGASGQGPKVLPTAGAAWLDSVG